MTKEPEVQVGEQRSSDVSQSVICHYFVNRVSLFLFRLDFSGCDD